MRKFSTQAGFNLAELTVALGILGITSLIVVKLAQNGAQSGNQVAKDFEIIDFQSKIYSNLSNVVSCSNTLLSSGAIAVSSITGTNELQVQNIKSKDNDTVLMADSVVGSQVNGVKLTSMKLKNYNSVLKTADLETIYTYNLAGDNSSASMKTKKLSVSINTNAAGTNIDNCYLTSSSTDGVSPKVTIEQSVTQVDPTTTLPVNFVVAFDEPIDPQTFTTSDITNAGTATGVVWSLTTSDNTTWTLSATNVTVGGTLVPSIAANAVKDKSGNKNLASTSVDNNVTYSLPTIRWMSGFQYTPYPDNMADIACDTIRSYFFVNKGTTSTGTISISLSSTAHYSIVRDSCNNRTLCANCGCYTYLRINASTLPPGTYSVNLEARINGGAPYVHGISANVVTTDPCTSNALVGKICGGCKSVYAGTRYGFHYYTTPGNCTDSVSPTCDLGTDTLTKLWTTSGNQISEGATSNTDGALNTNILAVKDHNLTAKFCSDLVYDGRLDWFLPSKDEMWLYYWGREMIGGFNTGKNYATSTEVDADNYLSTFQGGGSNRTDLKSLAGNLFRCIRRNIFTDICFGSSAPAVGTSCYGGSKFAGALTTGGVSARYMVTPGGCTNNVDETSQFTATCNGGTDTVTKSWGTNYDHPTLTSSTPDANSGEKNTVTLSNYATAHSAARFCQNLVYGGHTDWFLPNREELNLIYTNRAAIGGFATTGGAFNDGSYWSSTENTSANSSYLAFSTGTTSTGDKSSALYVRCVRRY